MKRGLLILAASLMTLAPVAAPAAVRGFVVVGRPYYGGFYRPYWGPAYGGYFANPNAGEIKLDTKVKDAGVFINGAYAGTTHQNKSMHLRPGTYTIRSTEYSGPAGIGMIERNAVEITCADGAAN